MAYSLTCKLCNEFGVVAAEAIINPDDIIVLFESKISEVHSHVLLCIADDCPHTM